MKSLGRTGSGKMEAFIPNHLLAKAFVTSKYYFVVTCFTLQRSLQQSAQ
jgi:hypothetical protein